MKLKNFLLGSLCMLATTASAQFTGTGYYVVKSNSGKYLSVINDKTTRTNGAFDALELTEDINNACILYITGSVTKPFLATNDVALSEITEISAHGISALKTIGKTDAFGTNPVFEVEDITEEKTVFLTKKNVSTGKYRVKGSNDTNSVYLKETSNGKVGTKGGENSDIWEIIPYAKETGDTFLAGDANDDGEITLSDLSLLRKYIVKLKTINDINNVVNADADKDGDIDIDDLDVIKDKLLNQ